MIDQMWETAQPLVDYCVDFCRNCYWIFIGG